jgi:DNA invertase Pin-like site-specific DNA recombinase
LIQVKQAVGYLRVSGKGQVKGTGFARQKEAIGSYASQARYQVTDWYKEAHTGTESDRPEFTRMIEDLLSNGIRIVIVESMDRLARDLMVSHQMIALLIRKNITLISATTGQNVTESMSDDPMLKALTQIQSVFAELEKNLLVRKLKQARKRVREQEGRCEGRKPFGFNEVEKPALKRIQQLHRKPRNRPRLGYYQIARILNDEGHPTRTGKRWTGPTVMGILKRQATTV